MNVFLFPGQGSQKVGMGADLDQTPQGQAAFDKAQAILGYDLREICVEGPEDRLKRTLYTQPALYVVSCILTDLMVEKGIRPGAAAGHSAGEYAALYAAGVYDFDTGLEIVGQRAQLMDVSGDVAGGMAAIIGMAPEAVERLVEELAEDGILGVAAYNTDGQTVLSGEKARVEKAAVEAKARGARLARVLPVSGAFHSNLMKEAAASFAETLTSKEFRAPSAPYISNLTGQAESDPEVIRRGLAKLLLNPVRWTDCLRTLSSLSPRVYYEVGPGSVLAGLLKKFNREANSVGIDRLSLISELSND